jgi:hypothetical protein
MARKVTEDTWDEIQKNTRGDYYILSEDSGKVEVELMSDHYVVETGDEDLAGRIWDKEWPKNEMKAMVDGDVKIVSLGWDSHPFLRTFIARCKKNGIKPDQLVGTKWTMEKVGEYAYEIEYLGRGDSSPPNTTTTTQSTFKPTKVETPVAKVPETDDFKFIKDTVLSLKDEPELSQGKTVSEFLAIVALKAQIPKKDVEIHFDTLKKNGILKEINGTIVI